ncbi:MAG: hypothetical protein IKJ22_02415 [Paludibacteraceae bacterium]|nr:hypothetical protein [Paludibacteraceae bacterium]
MKKRLFLTTAFVAIFGCFVSMADVHDRDYRGNGKGHKTERVDKKGDKKHDFKKDKVNKNHKPNKPVAHKPAPKPNHKPVAHRPHKPAPKPVCHVKHHHKVECHKKHCNKVVFNPFDPFAVRAFTTAAVVAAILD